MAEPGHGSAPLAEALTKVGDRSTLLVVEALPGHGQEIFSLWCAPATRLPFYERQPLVGYLNQMAY